jgi:hypothetical protein
MQGGSFLSGAHWFHSLAIRMKAAFADLSACFPCCFVENAVASD